MKTFIVLALVALSAVSVASAISLRQNWRALGSKGGLEQIEGFQAAPQVYEPQYIQQSAPIYQQSYQAKGYLPEFSRAAPSYVQPPLPILSTPILQNSYFPAVFHQPRYIQSAPIYQQLSSYPTKSYQQEFRAAPLVQESYVQQQQLPVMTQAPLMSKL